MGIFGDFFGGSKKTESTASVGGGRGGVVEKSGERATYYKDSTARSYKRGCPCRSKEPYGIYKSSRYYGKDCRMG